MDNLSVATPAVRPATPVTPALPVHQGMRHAAAETPGPATAAQVQGDSMEFDSLDNAESERYRMPSPNQQRQSNVRPSIEQLRRMPQRRLQQMMGALNGHSGAEGAAEQEFITSASRIADAAMQGEEMDSAVGTLPRDPLRRFVALRMIERMMQQRLKQEAANMTAAAQEAVREKLAKVGASIDRLLRSSGRRIRSGLNTAEALQTFSDQIEERDRLRNLYYDTVVQGPSVRETFERLLKAFGAAKFLHTVRTMRNAIVDDMKAPFPSANRILLETYYNGLKEAHLITGLIHSSDELKKRVGECALQSDDGLTEFLSQVLRYTEGPGNARQFKQLCDAVSRPDEEQDLQEEERIVRHVRHYMLTHVPMDLWINAETRDTVLTPRKLNYKPAAAPAAPAAT